MYTVSHKYLDICKKCYKTTKEKDIYPVNGSKFSVTHIWPDPTSETRSLILVALLLALKLRPPHENFQKY